MYLTDQRYQQGEALFAAYLDEIKPLLLENHQETGVFSHLPFDPDYDRLIALEEIQALRFFVLLFEGEVVGASMFYIDTLVYQKDIKSAVQAFTFITKEHRGKGLAFMRFCDDILIKQGVNSIWRQSTAKLNIDKIYERMGYTFVEKSYRKEI